MWMTIHDNTNCMGFHYLTPNSACTVPFYVRGNEPMAITKPSQSKTKHYMICSEWSNINGTQVTD